MEASGRSTIRVELVHSPIELAQWRSWVGDPDVGAHLWFEGVTRRTTGDQKTSRLTYEAFEPMALSELQRLGDWAVERFALTRLVIVHRLGTVEIGETSVLVGCSSPHRAAVMMAMPEIMNRLKSEVPIWKRQHDQDGEVRWVHPR